MYWLLALALVVVLFFLLSSLPSWLVPASTGTTTTTTRRPRMRFTRISSVWGFLKSLRWYLFALAIALGLVWLLGAEKTNSIFAWMWRFLLDTDQEQVRGWYGAGAEEIPSLTFSSHFLLKVAGISAVIGLASLLLFKKKKLWRTVLIGIVSIPIVAALLAFWGDLSGSVGGFDSSDTVPWLVSTPWTFIHWLG